MSLTVDKQAEQSKLTGEMRLSIALTFFTFILIGANDGGLGVLIPSIRTYYHIDNIVLSYIFIAGSLGYIISALFCGLLIEKLGIRRFLIVAAIDYVIGAGIYSLQPPFVVLLLAAFFLGTSVGSMDAGLNSYMAALPNNTRLLNYLHAFYGVGAWLGPIIGAGLLALQLRWGSIYIAWGILALIVLIGLFTIFRVQSPAQPNRGLAAELRPHENVLRATLRVRAVWIACLLFVFYTGTEVSTGNWSVTFLLGQRHSSEFVAGWIISGYWLGLTLGRLVLGHIAERIGPATLVMYSMLGAICGVLIIWLVATTIGAILGLFIIGFCLGPIFPTVVSLMPTFVAPRLVPSAIGFLASSANIGAALLSWLAGSLIEHVSLIALWPYEVFIIAAMLALWLILIKQGKNSTATIEKYH